MALPSRVVHNCHDLHCLYEVLLGVMIASFFRILYQETLGILFSIQVQNVNDDSSSLCDGRCKAKGAEGLRRMVEALHIIDGLWKVEVCHHQCFTSTPILSSNKDVLTKIS